jgi:hypothetical protein
MTDQIAGPTKLTTEYVILEQLRGSPDTWVSVGKYTARDAAAAIREHAEDRAGVDHVVYVAIPARSWRPVTVTTETTTTLRLEEASNPTP